MQFSFRQIITVMQQLIKASPAELKQFLSYTTVKNFRRLEMMCCAGQVPGEIFFINKGIIRVTINDNEGKDHTIHFGLENQFIADYSSFLLQQPAVYSLQALEPTELVVLPRACIEWGYLHMEEGQKLGRLIAEFYFIYQDERIRNQYARTPRERYDYMATVFPNIHNRVPQHMIASYLGITAVHLSRLKKQKG